MKGINGSKALLAVILLAMLGMTIAPTAAQITWSGDIRLTNDSAYSKEPSVAVDSDNNIHISWYDKQQDGQYEIYYTKLDNNGNTLVDDTRLTTVPEYSKDPSVAVDSSGNVHIAWHDKRDGQYEIYYTKLNNTGYTLVDDTRLTDALLDSDGSSIAVDSSGNVHIAWTDKRDSSGYRETYYTKLDNNGNTLVGDTRLTYEQSTHSYRASIAVDSSGNVHIVWSDHRDSAADEIYYTKLNNTGYTLVDDTRLTIAPSTTSQSPVIAVDSSDNVHIAWQDYRDVDLEIYYTKLDNNGNTLVNDTRLTTAPEYSQRASIAVDSSDNVHIAWQDKRDGSNYEIYYTELDNNGNTLVDDTKLTDSAYSKYASIAVDSSDNVHIAWQDMRDGNYEIYYKKGSAPAAPSLEFGDAPDPTYPSNLSSDGSRHTPTDTECLGLNITGTDWKDFELDANVPDADLLDDGLLTFALTTGNPAQTVDFEVTNNITDDTLLVNILLDLNGDGDWNDTIGTQSEHVVQNQAISLSGPADGTFTSTPFSTVGATEGATWMRITLTRQSINTDWNGTMASAGYAEPFGCGETEDWEVLLDEKIIPAVETATGTGIATFESDAGTIDNLTAVPEGDLPAEGKPVGMSFPHGFFSLNVTGLADGQTVNVTITLPDPVPVGTQYWKYGPTIGDPADHWYQIPIGDDDGDNVITITLVDGGLGDDILTQDGMIVDPGGSGTPPPAPEVPAMTPVGFVMVMFSLLGLVVFTTRAMNKR